MTIPDCPFFFCSCLVLHLVVSSRKASLDIDTKITSANIIQRINSLEILYRKIFEYNTLATSKTNQKNSSLQVETKNTSTGAQNYEKFSENLYPTLKIPTKRSPKSGSGLLRFYSLQCLTQNCLKRRVRLPLCDLGALRKIRQLGKAKPVPSSGFRTKTFGYFTRCHRSTCHPHSLTDWGHLFFKFTTLQQLLNYGDSRVTNFQFFFMMPTERRLDITAFPDSHYSGRIERPFPLGNPVANLAIFFLLLVWFQMKVRLHKTYSLLLDCS